MTSQCIVKTVLRVKPDNLSCLLKGQAIAAISQTFIRPGQCLLICPSSDDPKQEVTVDAWFRCQSCCALDNPDDVDNASLLTAVDAENLKDLVLAKGHIFLVNLRGYWLSKPVSYSLNFNGQFAALPQSLNVVTALPILSNQTFLEKDKLQPPKYPELEELYLEISKLSRTNLIENGLLRDIQLFLGCLPFQKSALSSPSLSWIKTIVKLGNRALEEDNQRKSNHQAGTDFEHIVRQGLDFLGFTVDPQHKGGAGGLDLFCSEPYALAIECKCGRSIPDNAVEQIDRIAKRHLKDKYREASRLIIGPGIPTQQLKESSIYSAVSIMHPKSLQRLVEMQAKYPNSIDLVKLREHLKPGIVDQGIDQYIEEDVLKKLRFYSQILNSISSYLKQNGTSEISTKEAIRVYRYANFSENLSDKEIHDILIELSSPFAGYLGRKKALDSNWIYDRFYYLRDLLVE